MNSNRTKRRALSARAVAATLFAAMTTKTSSNVSVAAFMAIDTASLSFSSTRVRSNLKPSSKRFATLDSSDAGEKANIQTITDDNLHTLLDPPSSPGRAVLVDAFAPWCGPCKLLDKVLRKAQPRYEDKVDFVRWNVNDKENTVELKNIFMASEFKMRKLPSLIMFRDGKPVAMREGMANEFQLDFWLESTLPELEKTFDEDGVKLVMLPEVTMKEEEIKAAAVLEGDSLEEEMVATVQEVVQQAIEQDCTDPTECYDRLERTVWQNRTVVPAMDGILLPARR
mmetsp:Transcript_47096/g.98755  ORF Transcript_47096/g.98755 Transcript_47096/m.98755 type:complete len:283 (+) Transcript_47096:452-1300(+)